MNYPTLYPTFISSYLATLDIEKRVDLLVDNGIVEILDSRFVRKNYQQRNQEELTDFERFNVHDRSGGSCSYCGLNKPLQVDHIIPRSAWPEKYLWLADDGSNLTSACLDCNAKKSNRFIDWLLWTKPYPFIQKCEFCLIDEGQEIPITDETEVAWCMTCGTNSHNQVYLIPTWHRARKEIRWTR